MNNLVCKSNKTFLIYLMKGKNGPFSLLLFLSIIIISIYTQKIIPKEVAIPFNFIINKAYFPKNSIQNDWDWFFIILLIIKNIFWRE